MRVIERVLAATDGSEHGANAVATAVALAGRLGAELQLASVIELHQLPLGVDVALHEGSLMEDVRRRTEEQAGQAGLEDPQVLVRSGMAAPTISELCAELETNLLVVGAHPRPAVARFLVGSTAERMIRLARIPVLVATRPRGQPYRKILAAVDLSRHSAPVLETAVAVAAADGAELHALYVQDHLSPMLLEAALFDERETHAHARRQFENMLEGVSRPSELIIVPEMGEGHPGREILHEAEQWDADLIVMGSHGFGFFNRLLLGSTSIYVMRHGHRDTLVVPRSEEG